MILNNARGILWQHKHHSFLAYLLSHAPSSCIISTGKAHAGISPFVKIYINDFLVHRTKTGHSQSPKWEDEKIEFEINNESVGREGGELTVEDFHSEIRIEVYNHKTPFYDEYVGEVTVELAYWKIFELRKGQELELNLSSTRSATAAGAIKFNINLEGSPISGETEQMMQSFRNIEGLGENGQVKALNSLIPNTNWKILNRTEIREKHQETREKNQVVSAYEVSIMLCGMTRSISQVAVENWEEGRINKRSSLKRNAKEPLSPEPADIDHLNHDLMSLQEISCRLQGSDLKFDNPDEQAAFWLNVYHSLLIHSVAVSGFEPYDVQNPSHPFFVDCYLIGGLRFSAADIRLVVFSFRF
jgi:hypothetical protein